MKGRSGPSTPDDGADKGAIRIDEAAYRQVQAIPKSGYTRAERDRMIAGIEIGSLDGVKGYFNGNVEAEDWGSNVVNGKYTGLKWQCVEYVRRYYLVARSQHLTHRGNASSWHTPGLADGGTTFDGLRQYVHSHGQSGPASDGFTTRPQKGDVLVFGTGTFGHVVIVSEVTDDQVTFAQQNVPKEGFIGTVNMERNGQKWRLFKPGKHVRALLRKN